MAKLERLYISNNSLSGPIPSDIGNIPHLGLLDLSKNRLNGSIPNSIANLSQLRKLLLYQNQLSGMIPTGLGNCTNLEILDLSRNSIVGMIPYEVAGLRSLKLYLNLSSNHLHGPIPLELSKMDMIQAIDLSSNDLSGFIPTQLSSCIALEYLNISKNIFQGTLPDSLGQLPYLQVLDVSYNNLTGQIPQTFSRSSTLKFANFSYNSFTGNVSNDGIFSSLTVESFLGNTRLCGMIHGMPRCRRRHSHLHLLPVLLIPLSITFMVFVFAYPLALKARIGRPVMILRGGRNIDEGADGKGEYNYPRLSYKQLIEATGGFCSSSLIGSGQFGHVYKGVLKDNTNVAIKVLDNSKSVGGDLSGSFKRECEVLKRTRHRNLIKIITICSKPDFKALVLPLMSNGSLERHLYPTEDHSVNNRLLTLARVISICSDVAEGVAYLHHHSPVRVVHCDLKPSNILLDENMTALVADFGIARLVKFAEDDSSANEPCSYNSTDALLCGSIGYIAPEYGMGKRASTQGDVFSFGVLLLEIIVGRRPTEVLVDQSSSLHEWVKSRFPNMLDPIISHALTRYVPPTATTESDQTWRDVVAEIVELGVLCTQSNPCTRPSMLEVCIEMNRLKQCVTNPSLQIILE
uniref:non-specific serine/threonine protein kinase n=1 Tax=Sedum alfredii TaxID=439688 RepID=A0A410N653_9MAGN|nr:leucine-rich repeat receptor-like serine/threonine-protein kinase [Sedum alfredii]